MFDPRPRQILRSILVVACLLASTTSFAAVREGSDAPASPDPTGLGKILARVDSLVAAQQLPTVVFDLDGTLLDPAPRNRAIFSLYARENPRDRKRVDAALRRLPLERYAYYPESTLARMGLTDTALVRRMKQHWSRHFFSNRFLGEDAALPGATAYVDSLWQHGAWIVYLTGRDLPRMLEGTAATLRDRGFPMGRARVTLIMKPDAAAKDREFKQSVLDDLARSGPVVGVFENEPANLNLLAERFPDAVAVFVDTNHSAGAPPVIARAYWVRGFTLQ